MFGLGLGLGGCRLCRLTRVAIAAIKNNQTATAPATAERGDGPTGIFVERFATACLTWS